VPINGTYQQRDRHLVLETDKGTDCKSPRQGDILKLELLVVIVVIG
jgi:hypothetical protein